VRLHVPAHCRPEPLLLERRLRSLSCVRSARASARTGNLLLHFDPRTPAETVLAAVRRVLEAPQPACRAADPVNQQPPLPPAHLLPILPRLSRPAPGQRAAVLHHGLAALRCAADVSGILAGPARWDVAAGLTLPLVRQGLDRSLGQRLACLLTQLAEVVLSGLAGGPLALALAVAGMLLRLACDWAPAPLAA
jgi:hypothetical protein